MFVVNFDNQLINLVDKIESVDIFRSGRKVDIQKSDKMFSTIWDKLVDKLENCRILPALAVSMHEATLDEMKSGLWIQINFDTTYEIDGLPFDSLLFKLEKTNGINLIRKYQGKYEGRCIYIYIDTELDGY